MIYIGIDNGLHGGMVALNDDGKIIAKAIMPIYPKKKVKGERQFVVERDLCKWLKKLKAQGPCKVCLERPTFSQSATAAVSMHDSFGTTRTVIKLLGMALIEVDPKHWQACFWKKPKNFNEIGWTTKNQALRTVNNNWLNINWLNPDKPKSRTPHDGMIDACLIAEYRRRFYE